MQLIAGMLKYLAHTDGWNVLVLLIEAVMIYSLMKITQASHRLAANLVHRKK